MRLLTAEFVTSAAPRQTDAKAKLPRDGVAQVALAGRSNVGKSSLLNALCRTKIARTSAAPGKTRLVNIYRVTAEGGPGGAGRWSVYLVDLPGYGYARGGDAAAEELRATAEGYLLGGGRPRLVLHLVDSRHPGLDSDRAAARWLESLRTPRQIVATKIDKLTRAERARNLRTLETVFEQTALPVSAASGEGLDVLWTTIAKIARDADRRG